ncbi:MAG: thioesterase family protein [Oscillospiraceae bacterium]|nr:thioesterase family protein [Oscillospiraceae bacterium]
MKEIKVGLITEISAVVDKSMLAVNVGSGSLEVLATPVMIMLMEKASCQCIADYLENDETTVGTEINVKHISATPENMNVTIKSTVTDVNNREITFKTEAFDDAGKIGEGVHRRFLVYGEKFTQKAKSKLN